MKFGLQIGAPAGALMIADGKVEEEADDAPKPNKNNKPKGKGKGKKGGKNKNKAAEDAGDGEDKARTVVPLSNKERVHKLAKSCVKEGGNARSLALELKQLNISENLVQKLFEHGQKLEAHHAKICNVVKDSKIQCWG